MNKEIREKFESYIKLHSDRVAAGVGTRVGYNNRMLGVLKGLEMAGVITEEESRDLYFEYKK